MGLPIKYLFVKRQQQPQQQDIKKKGGGGEGGITDAECVALYKS